MEEHGAKIGLLDYITFKSGCMYLSDLHEPKNLPYIRNALRGVEPSMFGLKEWNAAAAYITGEDISFSSSEQAAEYLISYKKQ